MADISSVIDGFFFGYVVTLVLLGITIVQFWIYVHNNNDTWPLRTFVSVLILLDLAETACTTQLAHHYLISHFGDLNALKLSNNVISVNVTLSSITFFLVHLFFANRLWKLGRSWYLPATITFTSMAMLAMRGIVISAQIPGRLQFSDYKQHRILIYLMTFHALSLLTDILTTVGLSWSLSTSQPGFKNTRTVLQRLLAFTVTRGILVCLVQIGHIVMYALDSTNLLFWVSLHLALTKLYVLTTLVTLNLRESLRDILQAVDLSGFHTTFALSARLHASGDAEAIRHSEVPSAVLTGPSEEPDRC